MTMKEPLKELFDLYEATVAKPPLKDAEEELSTPQRGYDEHPVIQNKGKVDALRLSGMSATDAHQQVNGPVDTSDQESKAELAKTLGRTQEDGSRKGVFVDKDAEHKSLLAKDEELEDKLMKTTSQDMKTPIDKEVPDALEPPESLDKKEEYDYNADVEYILKYGR